LSLGVSGRFIVAGSPIGGYDGDKGAGGSDEKGFHGECEIADGVETEVRAVDDCSALKITLLAEDSRRMIRDGKEMCLFRGYVPMLDR
jgi:hypothetical protein